MRRMVVVATLGALLLGGCADPEDGGAVPAPGPARIDVDTPELRRAKQAAGVADCEPGKAEPAADGLPSVALPCLGGGPDVDLATLRGPLLVNFWAGWCGPCRQELPVLQSFYEKHGERVDVVGVDYLDQQPPLAMKLLDTSGVTFPSVADVEGTLGTKASFGLSGLPVTAFIDADGKVAGVHPGEIKSEEQLRALVEEHLGVAL